MKALIPVGYHEQMRFCRFRFTFPVIDIDLRAREKVNDVGCFNSQLARMYLGQKKNYGGMSFWARGYFVSTFGTDEDVVRTYIRDQEKEDKQFEQLSLFK